jgi:hypothetical protein
MKIQQLHVLKQRIKQFTTESRHQSDIIDQQGRIFSSFNLRK